jgi:hypothetical protein
MYAKEVVVTTQEQARGEAVYEGGIRGLAMAVREFRAAGLTVEYEPPMERRDFGADSHTVVLDLIAAGTAKGLAVTVRAVVKKLREQTPPVVIRLDDQETWGSE